MCNLVSDNLKLTLLSIHQPAVNEAPYWLTLINHLQNEKSILDIKKMTQQNPAYQSNPRFQELLSFASQLTATKHHLHQAIKMSLLNNAGISLKIHEPFQFSSSIQSPQLSDKQLFKLWHTCQNQLETSIKLGKFNRSNFILLIRMMNNIGIEFLVRAKTKPDILNNLNKAFAFIEPLHKSLTVIFDKSSSSNPSFWPTHSEATQLIEPLVTTAIKAHTLQAICLIEQYAKQKLSKNKFAAYRQYCNDAIFSADTIPEESVNKITQLLDIKKRLDAKKIINTMKVYHHLLAILDGKSSSRLLATIIHAAKSAGLNTAEVITSCHYSKLFNTLASLAVPIYPVEPQNDSKSARLSVIHSNNHLK